MPFPNLNPLVETFLEPTRIFLFGKPFPSLQYDPVPMGPAGGAAAAGQAARANIVAAVAAAAGPAAPNLAVPEGSPPGDFEVAPALAVPTNRVEQALRNVGGNGIFARIYAFSFEGHYYKLPRPLLFLVEDIGRSRVPEDLPPANGGERQFNTRFAGIEAKDWQFGSDIQVWAVDKHDIAICLDLEVGKYEQVLLDSMIAAQDDGASRGAAASRGAVAGRGAMSSRGAASFRGAMVGPHQER